MFKGNNSVVFNQIRVAFFQIFFMELTQKNPRDYEYDTKDKRFMMELVVPAVFYFSNNSQISFSKILQGAAVKFFKRQIEKTEEWLDRILVSTLEVPSDPTNSVEMKFKHFLEKSGICLFSLSSVIEKFVQNEMFPSIPQFKHIFIPILIQYYDERVSNLTVEMY